MRQRRNVDGLGAVIGFTVDLFDPASEDLGIARSAARRLADCVSLRTRKHPPDWVRRVPLRCCVERGSGGAGATLAGAEQEQATHGEEAGADEAVAVEVRTGGG